MPSRLIITVAAFLLLALAAMAVSQQNDSDHKLSGPYVHENLSIFLVHDNSSEDSENLISLKDAMEKGYVTVNETGNVGELTVSNNSHYRIYIQSGDLVKGGRQDRLLRHDLVLEPNAGEVPLKSFCVEHGRWSGRSGADAMKFESSENMVVGKDIKLAVNLEADQQKVWDNIARMQSGEIMMRGGRSGSLVLMMDSAEHQNLQQPYIQAIKEQMDEDNNAVGMVVVINGEINCADIYRSHDLFEMQFDKLLKSAAIEAVAVKGESQSPIVSISDVQTWLDEAENATAEVQEVAVNMQTVVRETDNLISFESRNKSSKKGWIHRSILSK